MTELSRTARNIIHMVLITIIAAACIAVSLSCIDCDAYAAEPQSSYDYKLFDDPDDYISELQKRMYNVYKTLGNSIDEAKTVPIPGLISTYTKSDGERNESADFIPQGLCRVHDYLLTTAYDSKKKHNSVIYVVDTDSDELVSTLTMPNKYHAGGIAFDGECIWMTGNTSDKYKDSPFVQYMTYDTFTRLIQKPLSEVERKDISDRVFIKNKPSFLECDNGTLWVGTYMGSKGTSEGYMYGYKIVGEPEDRRLNTIMYRVISGIDSCAQGADIDGKYLYVSSSYKGIIQGVKTSFVTKYNLDAADDGSDSIPIKGYEMSRIEVPKMNEEIVVDGMTIHINFESGSKRWRLAVVNTDRILAVKKSVWGR